MGNPTPQAPPDSESLVGICPNCDLPSSFEERGTLMVSAGNALAWLRNPRAANASLKRAAVYQCRNCHEGCVVVEVRYERDQHVAFKRVHCWPPPGTTQLDQSIPSALAEAFREGMRCLGADAPHAAAVMFRRTIEGIVRDKGSQKAIDQLERSDLPGALKIMAKEHDLDPTLSEWADEARGLGNVGGHFDPLEEVNPEQATDLSRLVRQILQYKYEEPARRERLRASRGT